MCTHYENKTTATNNQKLIIAPIYKICKEEYPSIQDLEEGSCFEIDLDKVYDYDYSCDCRNNLNSIILTYRDGSKNSITFKISEDFKKCYAEFKKTVKKYKKQKEVIK